MDGIRRVEREALVRVICTAEVQDWRIWMEFNPIYL